MNSKTILGFVIGISCSLLSIPVPAPHFDMPLPAPPKIVGALLVVMMTAGFITRQKVFLSA